jgi:hypothetical protein
MIDKEIFTKFDKGLDKSMLPFSPSKIKTWKDTFMAILQPQIMQWNEVMLLSLDYIKCLRKRQMLVNVLIQQ